MVNKVKTCVFISGNGSNLKSIIKSSRAYNFPIKVELVISNNINAYGIYHAKKYSIPFKIFSSKISQGSIVKYIKVKNIANKPRSFFDKLNEWSKNEGAGGLGYISFYEGEYKGPIAKNLDNERLKKLSLIENESVFFICDKLKDAQIFSGKVRNKIANDLDIINKKSLY